MKKAVQQERRKSARSASRKRQSYRNNKPQKQTNTGTSMRDETMGFNDPGTAVLPNNL